MSTLSWAPPWLTRPGSKGKLGVVGLRVIERPTTIGWFALRKLRPTTARSIQTTSVSQIPGYIAWW
jgi:hypothetical protein